LHNRNFKRFGLMHPCDGRMERRTGDIAQRAYAVAR